MPMFATLAAAPPTTVGSAPTRAFADPVQDTPRAKTSVIAEETIESGEPIAGPVPLPRAKPHGHLALITGAIPLPRPKPSEAAPTFDDLPPVDRHAIP
jgi:hypothetical protein